MDFIKDITLKQVVTGALILTLLIFIFQNMRSVRVEFLSLGFELPLVLLIFLVFITGYFTGQTLGRRNSKKSKPNQGDNSPTNYS